MTTSVFTQQAEEQATSPGYKPIDLIDGERLVQLLQEYDLGIKRGHAGRPWLLRALPLTTPWRSPIRNRGRVAVREFS